MVKFRKILILGAKGMLGSELVKVFKNLKPICFDQADLDISNKKAVFAKLTKLTPDLVINAAAYTAVDDCEKNKGLARRVNGLAPGYLAQICKKLNAVLVHYSTDYVFAGRKKTGYLEKDKPRRPLNVYGQTKLLGEQNLQRYTDRFYLIRTSWLFGLAGKNFVETILRLGKNHLGAIPRDIARGRHELPLRVVNDQFGKPTYALDLAQRTRELIEIQPDFGIYHLTNETKPGGISWYQFAKEIFKQASLSVKLQACLTKDFPRPARRPHYSILNNSRLSISRPWQPALADYLKEKSH